MTKFRLWFRSNFKLVFISFLIGFAVAAVTVPQPASALELNAAWPCLQEALTSGAAVKVYVASDDSTEVRNLPTAYMVWEKHGNEINVRRFYSNVAETNWIGIPAGQSIIIPAPPAFKRTGSTAWWHKMAFYGAAGDTILYLPMKK